MIMLGHHDRAAIEKLRLAAVAKGRTVRVVDQKTVVLPLSPETLDSPDKVAAAVRSFLAPARAPARVSPPAARESRAETPGSLRRP